MATEIQKAIHLVKQRRVNSGNIEDLKTRAFFLEDIISDLIEALDIADESIREWRDYFTDKIQLAALDDIEWAITTGILGESCDCGCH